ncbi:MAG: nucleoside permease [Granulicella sp.]
MKLSMRVRLSSMMFLEYFIWGAWYVTVGTWLHETLHFSAGQIGLAVGTTAVGAILAPFFVGLIADRFFATQKVLAISHLIGGGLLLVAATQIHFVPFYWIMLLYCICYMPTMALTNSLTFRQMGDPKIEFGNVRVFGTLGWIVSNLIIGYLRWEPTALPMHLAAAASVIMGLYCFTMPDTPPLSRTDKLTIKSIFPYQAIALLKERSMLVFAIASFLICIPLQFYYAFTNLYLNQAGVQNAAGKMSAGQMSEMLCMLLIPFFFRRLGVKYMLVAAMLAWVARYLLFAYGNASSGMWMFWGAIVIHGICYDFFFVTGQIYIDQKANIALRAAAQGLITLITYGFGMFIGSWLSGVVVDHYALAQAVGAMTYNWRAIWLFSAGLSATVLVFFLFSFADKDTIVPGSVAAREAEAAALSSSAIPY